MTNSQRWNLVCRDLPSSQQWIDLALLSLISAALERRVWFGDKGRELYCNLFVTFVGPAGFGKTIAAKEVLRVLELVKPPKEWNRLEMDRTRSRLEVPSRFYLGPDTTTFEGLLADLAKVQSHFVLNGEKVAQRPFVLLMEELSSMFRRGHEQIPKAFLSFYDCGDYIYTPKNAESAIIRKPAVILLAGTTISFLQEAHKFGIFGDGLSSRMIWSYDNTIRTAIFDQGALSPEQLSARAGLANWIENLVNVVGKLHYAPRTAQMLQIWYESKHIPELKAAPAYLQEFLARKPVHLRKLAACIHFLSDMSLEIKHEAFEEALHMLDRVQANLAFLSVVGRNELSGMQIAVYQHIKRAKRVSFAQLMMDFAADLRLSQMTEILTTLTAMGKIVQRVDVSMGNKQEVYEYIR